MALAASNQPLLNNKPASQGHQRQKELENQEMVSIYCDEREPDSTTGDSTSTKGKQGYQNIDEHVHQAKKSLHSQCCNTVASCFCDYLCTELEGECWHKFIKKRAHKKPVSSSKLRQTLKSYLLSPDKKKLLKLSGKGCVHLLIVILLTIQLSLFVNSKLTLTDYVHANELTFAQLFVMNPVTSDNDYTTPIPTPISVIYTQNELFEQLNFTATQFFHLKQVAVGEYGYQWNLEEDPVTPQLHLKIDKHLYGFIDPTTKTYNVSTETVITDRYVIHNTSDPINDALNWTGVLDELPSVVNIQLGLIVSSVYVDIASNPDLPAVSCFQFNITFNIQSHEEKGNGMHVNMHVVPKKSSCNSNSTGDVIEFVIFQYEGAKRVDGLVITVSFIFMILSIRSLLNTFYIVLKVWTFFKLDQSTCENECDDDSDLKESCTKCTECWKNLYTWSTNCWKRSNIIFPLLNFWDIMNFSASFIAVVLSIAKLIVYKHKDFVSAVNFEYIPVFLGLAVFLQWCGLLRFLSYFNSFNILLVTLKRATPNVIRFCMCGILLFASYSLLGWLVLGSYHPKFRTILTTAECLFSLLNGDDMFVTFKEMSQKPNLIWIFSKIYLYSFICLFVFVVLSVFIALISNTFDEIQKNSKNYQSEALRFLKDFANDKLQVPNDSDDRYYGMSKKDYQNFLNDIKDDEECVGVVEHGPEPV